MGGAETSKFGSIPQFLAISLEFCSWIINDVLLFFNGLVPEAPGHGYSLRFKNNNSSIGKTISKTERHRSSFILRALELLSKH